MAGGKEFKTIKVPRKAIKDLSGPALLSSTSGLHGNQDKFGVTLGDSLFILKPRSPREDENPEAELLCNRIAELVGVDVAEYGLAEVGKETMFATKSFVRAPSSIAILRHFWTILGPNAHWSCETILSTVDAKSSRAAVDREQFVRICLFDALVGNSDRHARNLAMVYGAGQYWLSPAYDNLSPMVASNFSAEWVAELNWDGSIATALPRRPTFAHYAREFHRLGLGALTDQAVAEFRASLPGINKLIDDSELAFSRRQSLKERIQFMRWSY